MLLVWDLHHFYFWWTYYSREFELDFSCKVISKYVCVCFFLVVKVYELSYMSVPPS